MTQLFASHGHEVVLVDLSEQILDDARASIATFARLAALVRPGSTPPPAGEVLGRITFTTDLKSLSDAELVVENVTERWTVKQPLYAELDAVCSPDTVFGVNTSAIPITRVAAATERPEQVIGTHFMNPAHLKPTVEVIRGLRTSPETVERTKAVLDDAGRRHVLVGDSPGFVTNRVLMITINEAIALVHEGVSTPADVDRLFKECFAHSMGPLETADLIGLDTVLLSLEVLYADFGELKYVPNPLLRRMVEAGRCGRKTNQGFYPYASEGVRQ
ncbi:3-hydroxyacyl-CoA dehydrogenase family protein [Actinoplanes oblitus]|uniref:3-hydroxyacyl-CoA dehydrogenase family protein n=1 Tax=Actinoplanes oblitus TaxID=3040509 RepID=A0ABY8WFA2_9ACTN|nr:3-hydroxyacyl-CoA dehydrogenase family protein [Actinoplanes oblitus]WIM94410.1 3-hydroxyacyl-CoA dehydrogenase family protein [Actinoplanes oblitus]